MSLQYFEKQVIYLDEILVIVCILLSKLWWLFASFTNRLDIVEMCLDFQGCNYMAWMFSPSFACTGYVHVSWYYCNVKRCLVTSLKKKQIVSFITLSSMFICIWHMRTLLVWKFLISLWRKLDRFGKFSEFHKTRCPFKGNKRTHWSIAIRPRATTGAESSILLHDRHFKAKK